MHAPVMTTVKPGVVTVKPVAGGEERYVVFGGFADILPSGCTLLAESAVAVKDIDRADLARRIQDAREDVADATDDATRTKADELLSQLTTLEGRAGGVGSASRIAAIRAGQCPRHSVCASHPGEFLRSSRSARISSWRRVLAKIAFADPAQDHPRGDAGDDSRSPRRNGSMQEQQHARNRRPPICNARRTVWARLIAVQARWRNAATTCS